MELKWHQYVDLDIALWWFFFKEKYVVQHKITKCRLFPLQKISKMHCNVRKFWNLETLNQKWNEKKNTFNQNKVYLLSILSWKFGHLILAFTNFIQVILLEIDCAIFYTNLHELLCQFISWTNWVNSGKFMENCCISCQVVVDVENVTTIS